MLGIIMLVAAVITMMKVADFEGRSEIIWGAITGVLCLACTVLIPIAFVNILVGLVLSFIAMFVMKIIQKDHGG